MSILFLLTTLGTVATDLGHREESLRRKFKTEISNQFLTLFFAKIKFFDRNPSVRKNYRLSLI